MCNEEIYILYTSGCPAEMFRYPDFVFDCLDFQDLVQLQIGNIGAHPFYYETILFPPKFIVSLVPMTRTVD